MFSTDYYNLNMRVIPPIDIPSLTEVVAQAGIGNSLIGTAQRLNEEASAGAQLHAQRVAMEKKEQIGTEERFMDTALVTVVALTALSFVLPVSYLVILGICMLLALMGILLCNQSSTPETSSSHLHERELKHKKTCFLLMRSMTRYLSDNEVFQGLTRAADATGNFTTGIDFMDRVNRTGQLRSLIRALSTFVEPPLCMRGEVV